MVSWTLWEGWQLQTAGPANTHDGHPTSWKTWHCRYSPQRHEVCASGVLVVGLGHSIFWSPPSVVSRRCPSLQWWRPGDTSQTARWHSRWCPQRPCHPAVSWLDHDKHTGSLAARALDSAQHPVADQCPLEGPSLASVGSRRRRPQIPPSVAFAPHQSRLV